MSNGLGWGGAYSTTIERIKAQDGDKSRQGMAALMWVSYAERPLKADELCHALAIELGSKDFNAGSVPSISTIVNCCQGLITVDEETSTMRLAHFTVKEYLSARRDIFHQPHSAMAEICLTYLNSKQVKSIRASLIHGISDTRHTPLLEYCSLYWGVHAKRELSDCARSLALELFREYHGHVSRKLLLIENFELGHWSFMDFHKDSPFSGLHCASFFGISDLVVTLIEMECYDIDKGGFWGYTPLAWAASNGHEEVAKILLDREEVNPNKPANLGQTPLSQAACGGREGVVKLLLSRKEVYADMPDNFGKTPLSYAAWSGHEGAVKVLLECEEVNPDNPDTDGRTPLSYAAGYGHAAVVNILLGREEVNPDIPDKIGITPLSYAASEGHEGVVKILLGQEEVNPDKPNSWGKTPLSYAAEYGRESVVKILLDRGEVTHDKPDCFGRTPLLYAAMNGHRKVIALLQPHDEAITPSKLEA